MTLISTRPNSAISRPKNANNAIEIALFVLMLAEPPDADTVKSISSALQTVSEELPGTQQPTQQGFVIQIGNGMAPPFGEVMRFKAAPNGTHEWRVQITGNMVQVACQSFSDFGDVWETASRYIRLVLGAISPQISVQEVGYQVVDKFEYDVELNPADYDMAELFQKDSLYLTPQSWNCGLMWHVFQGWFETLNDISTVLNQLNISNTKAIADQTVNIIDHRVTLRATEGLSVTIGTLIGNGGDDQGRLDSLFNALHHENLRIIRGLLTEAKLESIGMKVAA